MAGATPSAPPPSSGPSSASGRPRPPPPTSPVRLVAATAGADGGSSTAPPPPSPSPPPASTKPSPLAMLLAGGLAGGVAATLTCPIEVVKTQLQSSRTVGPAAAATTAASAGWRGARGGAGGGVGGLGGAAAAAATGGGRGGGAGGAAPPPLPERQRPMDVVRRIARLEGPRGFFRGLPPTLVGILPSRSVYFWAYGTTKAALGPISPSTDLTHMGAAVVAGMTANTITNPVWLLKTRMQLQAGALSAAAAGTAAESAVGAAAGAAVGAAGAAAGVPSGGRGGGGGAVAGAAAAARRPPPSAAAVVGAARGAGGPPPAVGGLRVYAGYRDAIRTVYREEGIRGFYRGLTASYWGVTEGALHFLLYERLKRAAVARNYARAQREAAASGDTGDYDDDDDDEEDPLTNPAYALSSMQLVSSAALAKLVASMVTYPYVPTTSVG
ncbi:hypothetical protein MMPV_002013 [Pyropia vietnamensis]